MDLLLQYSSILDGSLTSQAVIISNTADDDMLQQNPDKIDVSTEHSNHVTTKKGSSKEEWERHRQTITRLYRDEDRPLREVMQLMEARSFFATKMYNNRIKSWRIDKNMKKEEALAMLALLSHFKSTGNTPTFFIAGREVNQQTLQQYARRAHISIRDHIDLDPDTIKRRFPQLSWHIIPKDLEQLRAPDGLHQQESVLQALKDYMHGAFESELCEVRSDFGLGFRKYGKISIFEIRDRVDDALRCLNNNQNMGAGILLRTAFLWSEELVELWNPAHWLEFSQNLEDWNRKQPHICDMLCKHILSIMRTRVPESIPQQRFVQSLLSQRSHDALYTRRICRDLVLQICKPHSDLVDQVLIKSDFGLELDARDESVLEGLTSRLLEQLSSCDAQDRDLVISTHSRLSYILGLRLDVKVPSNIGEFLSTLRSTADSFYNSHGYDGDIAISLHQAGIVSLGLEDWAMAKIDFRKCAEVMEDNSSVIDARELSIDLYDCYKELDWLSNNCPIADGDQQWRVKMCAVEQQWADELIREVGSLSLDEIIV